MNRHNLWAMIFIASWLQFAAPSTAQAQFDANRYSQLIQSCLAASEAGRYKEAEKYALQIMAEEDRPDRFFSRLFLGTAYKGQGRYKEAQEQLEQYVELCKRHNGESVITVEGMLTLGGIYLDQGLLKEAQPVLDEGMKMALKVLGPDHQATLSLQTNMGLLYQLRGDLQRSVDLYRDTIDRQHRSNLRDSGRLLPISNLVLVYQTQGRFDLAETMARYGLGVAAWLNVGADHPHVLKLLQNLASAYRLQNRANEARPLLEGCLAAAERTHGPEHIEVGKICADLASCYSELGDRDQEEAMLRRAIKIISATLGENHPLLAVQFCNLGWSHFRATRPAEAEQAYLRALKIEEAALGPDFQHHHRTAETRVMLARALGAQDKLDEAEGQLKLALADLEAQGIADIHRNAATEILASILWKRGDRAGAVGKIKQAIELAEASRSYSGGADVERAAFSHRFANSYELLLEWQVKMGNIADAFNTMERARARTFLESMQQSGVDLLSGREPDEKTQLGEQQSELRGRVTLLEKKLNDLPAAAGNENSTGRDRRLQAERDLTHAREALYQFERDLRSTSPAYRQLISTQPNVPSVAEVQKLLIPKKSLLLSYFFAGDRSYVFAILPGDARSIELTVAEEDARLLGVKAGPLTNRSLHQILQGDARSSVLAQLEQPGPFDDLAPKLNGLWRVLVPEELRKQIASGELERLVVLPHGPLALLPLEVLVVENSPKVKYLLDVAPAIEYGPSAAVLLGLAGRPAVRGNAPPVLTLGDPQYLRATEAAATTDLVSRAASRSRSSSMRQKLAPLPHSGTESRWVGDVFRQQGIASLELVRDQATESRIRTSISGREIIHLACHGMTDDAYGNFFGMLAVAPGKQKGNPQDDGMLTLAEIYGLDLRSCELAILSACRTNHGPEQQGEGVWSLSRGFLVAGARRVVASNWLVDDEAAASLVSVFCGSVAKGRKGGRPEYAASLQAAKRWVRNQEKWSHPYYWGTFVLVGPH